MRKCCFFQIHKNNQNQLGRQTTNFAFRLYPLNVKEWRALFEEPHEGQLFSEWSSTHLDWCLHLFEWFVHSVLEWNPSKKSEITTTLFEEPYEGQLVKSGVFHSFTFRENIINRNTNERTEKHSKDKTFVIEWQRRKHLHQGFCFFAPIVTNASICMAR